MIAQAIYTRVTSKWFELYRTHVYKKEKYEVFLFLERKLLNYRVKALFVVFFQILHVRASVCNHL